MTCPTCQSQTRVLDSRSRNGEVWRRRCCKKGHKFSTLERVELMMPERCRKTGLHPFPSLEAAAWAAKWDRPAREAFECRHCKQWHLTPVTKPHRDLKQT